VFTVRHRTWFRSVPNGIRWLSTLQVHGVIEAA
jgi:hypothetical protein